MGVVEKAIPVGGNIINNLKLVSSEKLQYVTTDTLIPIPEIGYKKYLVIIYSYDGVQKREEFEFSGTEMQYIGSFFGKEGEYLNILLCTGSGNLTMKYANTYLGYCNIFGIE